MKLAYRSAGGAPEFLVAGASRNVLRQRGHGGDAYRDDVGRVHQPVTPVARGGRPRYPQVVIGEFREQAPFDE